MKNRLTPVLWLFVGCIVLCHTRLQAQHLAKPTFKNDFSIISENDGYALANRDGYYTNGIYLRFSHASKQPKEGPLIKKIWKYELGQQMYTPYSGAYKLLKNFDRPFAGYLYAKVTNSSFYANHLWELSTAVGLIGQSSMAAATQIGFHKMMKGYIPKGWNTQIESGPTVNLGVQYVKPLLAKPYKNFVDVHAIGQVNIGTVFTNASVSMATRIGLMEPMHQSAFWGSRLHNGTKESYKHRTEIFLSIQPTVQYQLYDATIQGSLIDKNKDAIVSDINPLVFQCNIGLHIARPRWGAAVVFVHRSRDAVTMRENEEYGSLQFTYRMCKN